MNPEEIQAGIKATRETLSRAMNDVRNGTITHEALKRIIKGVNHDLEKLKQDMEGIPK
jgi:hypothetical protein